MLPRFDLFKVILIDSPSEYQAEIFVFDLPNHLLATNIVLLQQQQSHQQGAARAAAGTTAGAAAAASTTTTATTAAIQQQQYNHMSKNNITTANIFSNPYLYLLIRCAYKILSPPTPDSAASGQYIRVFFPFFYCFNSLARFPSRASKLPVSAALQSDALIHLGYAENQSGED